MNVRFQKKFNYLWCGILIFLGVGCSLEAASAHNYKVYGVSSHIGRDVFVNPGLEYDYDWYFAPLALVRAGAAVYQDSYRLWAGFLHLGPRLEAKKFDKLYLRFGIGPTFIWRQNWWKYGPSDYDGNEFYGKTPVEGNFETAFLFYGGDLEVEWRFRKNMGVTFSVIPGFPVVVNTNFGLRITTP